MGGRQQRSFPPTASSACHTSPLDNHPNAGRNKWDADPITARVLFLFVLFHFEKSTFQKRHISFWMYSHSVLCTLRKGCQQRSFPPKASSACHTSPLDNDSNAGINKWDADPITAIVLFLICFEFLLMSKRAHSKKKGRFHFGQVGGCQQRSFPPTAGSACHSSPLDNHLNAGRNKWTKKKSHFVLVIFPFHVEHFPKRVQSKMSTLHFERIHKVKHFILTHSILQTFHFDHIQQGHIPF